MVTLPWGEGSMPIQLPPRWRVLGLFTPPVLPPAPNPDALCLEALQHPFGTAPLAERDLRGKRVLLICDDHSRPTPIHAFFGAIRKTLLRAGADDDRIEILFALGTHRPMTAEEAAAKVGPQNLARHRWQNHDAFNAAQLVEVGTTTRGTTVWLNRLLTEFDLILALGAIEPHVLAGFSGGLKMILPGCAGAATAGHNHLQGLDGNFNHVGVAPEDSPMRVNLEEAATLLRTEVFLVNAALTAKGEVAAFFCGDPREAYRAGIRCVRGFSEVGIPRQADIVLVNSHPLDHDLRQGMKCFGHVLAAARPGGVLLGLLRCEEGWGDLSPPHWTLPYPLLRWTLRLLGEQSLAVHDWLSHSEPVEQRFLSRFGLQMLRRNHLWVYSDRLEPGAGRRLGLVRQFDDPEAMLAAAVRQFGPEATIAVFPQGGITYTRGPIPAQRPVHFRRESHVVGATRQD